MLMEKNGLKITIYQIVLNIYNCSLSAACLLPACSCLETVMCVLNRRLSMYIIALCECVREWVCEWGMEWMSEWGRSEWVWEWGRELMSQGGSEGVSLRVRDGVNEWVREGANEFGSEGGSEWGREGWMSLWMSEGMREWMSLWMREGRREWMS
jgi:hypothetical protein